MFYIKLEWKTFQVNLEKINIYLKDTIGSNYDGLVCDENNLKVMFKTNFSEDDTTTINSYWDAATEETFQPTSTEVATLSLQQRMDWGQNVIMQFRIYTLGISDEEGMSMLGNLMDVKMCLELGMLSAAAYLLSNKDANDVLDAQFDETSTVREKFVQMIMTEGPTP